MVEKPSTPGVDPAGDASMDASTFGVETAQSPSAHLATTTLFARVDRQTLARFDTDAHWLYLPGGQTLFRQGESADALYLVTRGSLQVLVEQPDGGTRLVDTLGRGAFVGEMALLLSDTRTATVVACRDCELVRIEKAEFDRLVGEHPSIAVEMARMLGARLKSTTRFEGRSSTLRTITLLPIGPGVAGHEFGERLTRALHEARHAACFVTSALVDTVHPGTADADPDSAAGRELSRWTSSLEDRFRYVIYQADSTRLAWTRRCLREADVTLLLGRAGGDPQPTALEADLTRPDQRRTPIELILLHEPGTWRIRGTASWLEHRRVARHHHVRADCDDDYRRIARFLTGQAVGLVLSGGGARGLAHIGVIKALRTQGVPIDVVGGASMGAIVAALCAAGHDADALAALARREFVDRSDFDFTLPMAALNSAASTVRKMKRLFGETHIEDLPVGFFCVSTNLTRAESVVHDRGPLWLWARVSCSIPGLAPPVPHQGDLLVDGGLLNNMPADVMQQRCTGTVIGVDVTPGIDLRTSVAQQPSVSGWRLLWERLRRPRRLAPFPTIVDILSRTALVGSIHDAARMRAHCDLYLEPPVERFGMNDFHAIDALIDAGYDAATEALATWPAQRD